MTIVRCWRFGCDRPKYLGLCDQAVSVSTLSASRTKYPDSPSRSSRMMKLFFPKDTALAILKQNNRSKRIRCLRLDRQPKHLPARWLQC